MIGSEAAKHPILSLWYVCCVLSGLFLGLLCAINYLFLSAELTRLPYFDTDTDTANAVSNAVSVSCVLYCLLHLVAALTCPRVLAAGRSNVVDRLHQTHLPSQVERPVWYVNNYPKPVVAAVSTCTMHDVCQRFPGPSGPSTSHIPRPAQCPPYVIDDVSQRAAPARSSWLSSLQAASCHHLYKYGANMIPRLMDNHRLHTPCPV